MSACFSVSNFGSSFVAENFSLSFESWTMLVSCRLLAFTVWGRFVGGGTRFPAVSTAAAGTLFISSAIICDVAISVGFKSI